MSDDPPLEGCECYHSPPLVTLKEHYKRQIKKPFLWTSLKNVGTPHRRFEILTKMHPCDSRSRRSAHLTVKPCRASFDDLQDVQLSCEQRLLGRRDDQFCTRGQLLCRCTCALLVSVSLKYVQSHLKKLENNQPKPLWWRQKHEMENPA